MQLSRSPVIVSSGGMEHYGIALQKSLGSIGFGDLTHYHVPTDQKFPDGQMDARVLPEGMYDELHSTQIIPVISNQEPHAIEGLRLLGYIGREIRGAGFYQGIAVLPYDASARADKDEGRISGVREMPYGRIEFDLFRAMGAEWLICVDHHNASHAKGRATGLKNLKSTVWEGESIKQLLSELGISSDRVAKLDPDGSAGQRTEQQMRVLHESMGFVPHRAVVSKVRDDVTGKTSIAGMRTTVRLNSGDKVTTEISDLNDAEVLLIGDDIISSAGTMIGAVEKGVKDEIFQSLKHVIFIAPHVLATSESVPKDFRDRAMAKINDFATSSVMRGVGLTVVAGNTLARPIEDPSANCNFKIQYADTSLLVAQELAR